MPKKNDVETRFTTQAQKLLLDRTIVGVRYMYPDEAEKSGWDNRPLIIIFDDDSWMMAQSDDEGNDAGVLVVASAKGNQSLFPVLPANL